jgi:solute carrier family 25 phosphate transporter 3
LSLPLAAAAQARQHLPKPSTKSQDKSNDAALYSRYALAGAVCRSFKHAILTPIDM